MTHSGADKVRTFVAAIAGFCLTSLLILAGEWGYTLTSSPGLQAGHGAFAIFSALLSLLYIAISVIAGGYLSATIDDSPEALAGFSVFQLFFGAWLFREFWITGFIWYKPAALFVVIPCAMLARYWARRSRRSPFFQERATH